MSTLKRIPIKYVRDRAKSRYRKEAACYVCGTNEKLDLHHLNTVDILFSNWCKKEKIQISTVEDILAVRDDFIAAHEYELYDYVKTLCKTCHTRLHTVYGQRPALSTADKQYRWLEKQKEKLATK